MNRKPRQPTRARARLLEPVYEGRSGMTSPNVRTACSKPCATLSKLLGGMVTMHDLQSDNCGIASITPFRSSAIANTAVH
jgi:hypothetical protein